MRLRRRYVFTALAAASVAAIVACTLNPQPLPPRDEASSLADASAEGGAFGTGPKNPPSEDAAGALDSDAQSPRDSGDGGDAGSDGGDAGPDADGG